MGAASSVLRRKSGSLHRKRQHQQSRRKRQPRHARRRRRALLGCEHNRILQQPRTHARRQNKTRHHRRRLRPSLYRIRIHTLKRAALLVLRHKPSVSAHSRTRDASQTALPQLRPYANCELPQVQRRSARRSPQYHLGLRLRQAPQRRRAAAYAYNNLDARPYPY